jgi:transcriptional regulator with XRE-family HTH domain
VTAGELRLRELGTFLRGRRLRLGPHDVGIDARGARRTPGLRREEVATLAGVSRGYYVRLEQGRGGPPSDGVLAALGRALRLDADEQAHLRALAAHGGNRHPTDVSAALLQQAREVLDLVAAPAAAYVIDGIGGVLAWNARAAALFVGLFPAGAPAPNTVRYLFANPAAKRLFPDWPAIADDAAAHLRAASGHRLDDPALRALVTDLTALSPEFACRWERRDVRPCHSGRKVFDHPVGGRIDLGYRVLEIPGTCHHRLVVYSAERGGSALARLPTTGQAAGRSW